MDLELWRPHDRYIAICARCGKEGLKRNMISLYVKDGAVSVMRILCHICPRCFPQLLDELEVSMPD